MRYVGNRGFWEERTLRGQMAMLIGYWHPRLRDVGRRGASDRQVHRSRGLALS